MSARNWVAKHMNDFNKHSVVPNKRSKHLDDLLDNDMQRCQHGVSTAYHHCYHCEERVSDYPDEDR